MYSIKDYKPKKLFFQMSINDLIKYNKKCKLLDKYFEKKRKKTRNKTRNKKNRKTRKRRKHTRKNQ
tara:strand:+ start:52 stop:249 length:198 start_codon:yes stop_codon:yes gene_type:complete